MLEPAKEQRILKTTKQMQSLSLEKEYIDLYKQHSATIKRHSAEVLNRYRDGAFALFEELGFPTKREEHYLYTDLREPLAVDYGLNINRLIMG